MKTKITLLIGAVAILTLSFTFSKGSKSNDRESQQLPETNISTPVGGLISDDVVK